MESAVENFIILISVKTGFHVDSVKLIILTFSLQGMWYVLKSTPQRCILLVGSFDL